nr:MAG TPA: hypothetical protein [Caudoviricetes sp.]
MRISILSLGKQATLFPLFNLIAIPYLYSVLETNALNYFRKNPTNSEENRYPLIRPNLKMFKNVEISTVQRC